MTQVVCSYCGQAAVFWASSTMLYRGKDYGPVWYCKPCQAWVGCHRGTNKPLGRLANQELRQAKISAHCHFDRLWQRRVMSRAAAYAWLAKELGIAREDCHIGMFDLETCKRVAELSRARLHEWRSKT